jgi:tRNA(Ile)-lysidine synthase
VKRLVEQVAADVRRLGLLGPGERVVLAVSGGADSVAMLAIFRALAPRQAHRWQLHVAHLNHRLRGADAEQDADFVARLADRMDVPATVGSADVAARAAAEGGSVEQVARRARYEFLADVAVRVGAAAVATAHTADDNAETVLHRICRGTGLTGLRGIPPVRPLADGRGVRLIRPLLGVSRADLRDHLRQGGLCWREDATNRDAGPMRNRLRHEVLPLLAERVNPQIAAALNRLAACASQAWAADQQAASVALEVLTCRRGPDLIELDAAGLGRLPQPRAMEVLRLACRALEAPLGGLGQRHLLAILHLAASARGGKRLDLPDGLAARMQRGRLILSLDRRAAR